MVLKKYKPRTLSQKVGHFIEECGEAMAAAGKSMRWGLESSNPELEKGETNRVWLLRELQDVIAAAVALRAALEKPAELTADDFKFIAKKLKVLQRRKFLKRKRR